MNVLTSAEEAVVRKLWSGTGHTWHTESPAAGVCTGCDWTRVWSTLDAVRAELATVKRERDEALESLPWVTNRTDNDVDRALDPVYRHRLGVDGTLPEIGVVEVTRAKSALRAAYADVNALRDRRTALEAALATERAARQQAEVDRDVAAVATHEGLARLVIEARAREQAEQERDQVRAALTLIADDHVIVGRDGKGDVIASILCSDTFAYATADAEDVTFAEMPALLRQVEANGWPAAVRWVSDRRKTHPLREVRKLIGSHDRALTAAITRAEAAEQERDAMRIRAQQFHAALIAVTPVLNGDTEWHDKGWCPGDDTCDCTIPTAVRVALGRDGWSKP